MKREQIILRLAQLWTLLLVVGSLQPVRPAPVVGLHRGIHWLAFAGVALLLFLLSHTRRQEFRGVFATCLLGLSLEYLQHLIYHNAMEWRDVRDDTLAIVAAFALYRLAHTCKAIFMPTPSTSNTTSGVGRRLLIHRIRQTMTPTERRREPRTPVTPSPPK